VKSPSAVFNRKFAFVVLMIFSGVFSLVASAAPSSIDQAKRAKIDMTLRIAAEQINRGLYKQAQVQLDNLKASDEYAAYISERQHQKILTLKAQVSMSLQERDKIVRALQQSELLAEQGNYMDAATLLSQVKDSQYASEQERQMMQKSYLEISQKNRAEQQKWQALLVRGEKTAEQYVLLIDSGAASRAQSLEAPVLPAAADPQPQVAPSQFDEEIEPIDLLEIEVDKQTADMASVQAQASGSRYVDEIIQKRTVQIDYTRAPLLMMRLKRPGSH
jgi:predicted DNA-binding protein (MmcQ/YjbR family)